MTGTVRVWEARTGGIRPELLAYSESVAEDTPFVRHDLSGSVAHVLGLHHVGLLEGPDAQALVEGLQTLAAESARGEFRLAPELEDLHMNIESRLGTLCGPVAARLHTGRSRNDQVATCMALYAREGLAELAAAAADVSHALLQKARSHHATPWAARTHGQPAQPATLGFLLAGHAWRLHDAALRVLAAFLQVGESPLGCGAVAGSTLPLEPAFTAALLGLRPPRNALLSTGGRDGVWEATTAAEVCGLAAASLAQDLLDLFGAKAIRIAPGFTTGSSLMPQKRNPDSLELARAQGKRLAALHGEAVALTAGLGLGYHRDFQATKPILTASLATATETLRLMALVVATVEPDPTILAQATHDAGLVATDVAEALVANGTPFRAAYDWVAKAYHEAERGTPVRDSLAGALKGSDLERALTPDPAKRDTLAGTAPRRVAESLDSLEVHLQLVSERAEQAQADAKTPFTLLSRPAATLVAEAR
ncbi:MAG: argininosuccinate lyase [Thermoplasmatota archaeon]